MTDHRIRHDLSPDEAGGITVNERLYVSGLIEVFDDAVERHDSEALSEILRKVYLDEENTDAIIEIEFGKKK